MIGFEYEFVHNLVCYTAYYYVYTLGMLSFSMVYLVHASTVHIYIKLYIIVTIII